jgi:hypothetical protein
VKWDARGWGELMAKDHDWQTYTVMPWRSVKLIDGSEYGGDLVMRRKVKGVWEYRALTAEEAHHDWCASRGW